jgi:hypothetical protein
MYVPLFVDYAVIPWNVNYEIPENNYGIVQLGNNRNVNPVNSGTDMETIASIDASRTIGKY